ncbi:MAG: LacI family transcriptional regulator [Pseudonocardia sp.]|nr:LacI family transcriptional regulator [Pseudonocardia sp.]
MADRPTIYDVARSAGVAPSTVSRALARPGRVSAGTAERVRAAAAELGYRALPQARAASTAATGMIALVISDITNPFGFEIIRGAEHAASDAGYTMILSDAQESGTRERTLVERAMPSVDGIVLASSRMSDSTIRMMAKQKPTVVLNRAVLDVPSVVTDNRRGAAAAVEHLRELGHDAVSYLAGPEASWADGTRWKAVLEAAQIAGVRARRAGPAVPTVDGGVAAAAELGDPLPTAVVAFNDQVAIGLVRGLRRRGVDVPGDVSVVGFDDIMLARLVTPELTTVAAPLRTMGGVAVRNLLAQIASSGATPARSAELPAQLVVRASTGPRRRRVRQRSR